MLFVQWIRKEPDLLQNVTVLFPCTTDESGNFGTKDYKGPTSSMKSKPNYTRTSTLAESLDKPPVPVFLPSKVRDNIFSYRDKYSRYLKQTETQHHGTFDPWKVVER